MNIKNLFILIILCTTLLHTYTMELAPFTQKTAQIDLMINYDCQFLKLPLELLDKIIFSLQPSPIGALKNSCKYLYACASIMRINKPTAQHFRIYDDATRAALFKTIIKTNNSKYIKEILSYGKREAHFYYNAPEDATISTILINEPHID